MKNTVMTKNDVMSRLDGLCHIRVSYKRFYVKYFYLWDDNRSVYMWFFSEYVR